MNDEQCLNGGTIKKLCKNDDCDICYNRSFASVDKSQFWSNKNVKKPREVFKSTATKFIFDCNECPHEFECSPNDITGKNRWCPFCCNKKLCSDNDCEPCFLKSFSSHDKAKFWSKKNKKNCT